MPTAAELRTQILASEDLRREQVDVPEWGLAVFVRHMTARERDTFEQQQMALSKDGLDSTNVRARLVALTCVDQDGTRIFADSDADELGNKSSAALVRIATVALRVNAITDDAIEAAVEK